MIVRERIFARLALSSCIEDSRCSLCSTFHMLRMNQPLLQAAQPSNPIFRCPNSRPLRGRLGGGISRHQSKATGAIKVSM